MLREMRATRARATLRFCRKVTALRPSEPGVPRPRKRCLRMCRGDGKRVVGRPIRFATRSLLSSVHDASTNQFLH